MRLDACSFVEIRVWWSVLCESANDAGRADFVQEQPVLRGARCLPLMLFLTVKS